MNLQELLDQIHPPDGVAAKAACDRWNRLAKPLGSLGLLEDALVRIAALTGSPDLDLSRRALIVFCADNGVIAHGVTQCGPEATAAVAKALAAGKSTASYMAQVAGCGVLPVDMGMLDFPGVPGVLDRRVRNGTADCTTGPAMTRQECVQAILTGAALVKEEADQGTRVICTGEMSIGNTTTSTAVACALLRQPVPAMTGRGAGLSDAGLIRKVRAIQTALAVNAPDSADPIDVLAKVGGLDLAALCGAFLGGAVCRVPVVIDGFISAVAALCALRLCPAAKQAMLASHVSAEPAGKMLLETLGLTPLITAGMRLGEGTGAVAALPLLDMALAVYQKGTTFAQLGMKPYTPQH